VATAAASSFVDRTPTSYVCKTCASPHYLVNTTGGRWVLSASLSGAAPLASVMSATVAYPPPFGWGMRARFFYVSVSVSFLALIWYIMAYHRDSVK
jgi:hypothetical protein